MSARIGIQRAGVGEVEVIEHIPVRLAGSRLAETAIAHAEKLAKGCGTKDISLIRVVERTKGCGKVVDASRQPEGQAVTEAVSRKERHARSHVTKMARKPSERGLVVYDKLVIGDPAEAIMYYGEQSSCDIIVMASHGRSALGRWALGSVADRVSWASAVPDLMVRSRGKIPVVQQSRYTTKEQSSPSRVLSLR